MKMKCVAFDMARLIGTTPLQHWESVIEEYKQTKIRKDNNVQRKCMLDYILYGTNLLIEVTRSNEIDKGKYIRPILENFPKVFYILGGRG